jgi:hypothetical protein
MRLLALDPGTSQSAWVFMVNGKPEDKGIFGNEDMLEWLRGSALLREPDVKVVIEMIASYGMAVGAEVFVTCVWIGRFMEALGRPVDLVYRKEIKMHLCNSMRANDAAIRTAIIDRYGGKDAAIGKKAKQGPLYGVRADMWSALALAICYSERSG